MPAQPSPPPTPEPPAPAPVPPPVEEEEALLDVDAEETVILEPAESAYFAPEVAPAVYDDAADAEVERRPRRSRAKTRADSRARRREEKANKRRPLAAESLVAALPPIKPLYAALITGALSGLLAVLLAVGASNGCESIRGTSSCGGGFGLLALVAILAIEVLIGANLLKAWRVSDPFSTSFLGVGLVAMLAMLFFLDVIDSGSMLVVIPVLTALSFVLSWWVTVRFVDEQPAERDEELDEQDLDQDEQADA
jgi:hypothetical protein